MLNCNNLIFHGNAHAVLLQYPCCPLAILSLFYCRGCDLFLFPAARPQHDKGTTAATAIISLFFNKVNKIKNALITIHLLYQSLHIFKLYLFQCQQFFFAECRYRLVACQYKIHGCTDSFAIKVIAGCRIRCC